MLPSSTVENYLKAIYQGQLQLAAGTRLVSMGQVAGSLGVTPGTATTMVKALAESGLAEYEPYSGVRLSAAGEKLAVLVLRRHRLVELFLVQIMGMSWDEVHDEAEQLEHVVSERLIERMDEMLGRPTHDPHGDPIPTPEGTLAAHHHESLLTCPVGAPLKVTRIADQDPAFLRFIEQHDLKPGQSIEVEMRDAAADSVRVRGRNQISITIGTRAASKLLVEVLAVLAMIAALLTWSPATAAAQESTGAARPFEITDNSFLVEEAFNQEGGIFQNIFGWTRDDTGAWEGSFTQEWPLGGMTHQLSYTVPISGGDTSPHVGNVLLHYRYQAVAEAPGRPAFAPRVSLLLPTGRDSDPVHRPGLQFNLPFSKQLRDVYLHWNAGVTWVTGVPLRSGGRAQLSSPFLAASAIWRTRPMFHLMFESVLESDETVEDQVRVGRQRTLTLSPGFRRGWNAGPRQIVVGAAVPVTAGDTDTSVGVLTYFSYELPFK